MRSILIKGYIFGFLTATVIFILLVIILIKTRTIGFVTDADIQISADNNTENERFVASLVKTENTYFFPLGVISAILNKPVKYNPKSGELYIARSPNLEKEDFSLLKPGMTEAEVEAIVGKEDGLSPAYSGRYVPIYNLNDGTTIMLQYFDENNVPILYFLSLVNKDGSITPLFPK